MSDQLVSRAKVANLLGVNATTIWRWETSDPTFPKPLRLSAGCVRWSLAEITAWAETKRAG